MTGSCVSVSHVSNLSGWSCWLIALDSNSNLISTLAHTSDTAPPSESLNLGLTCLEPQRRVWPNETLVPVGIQGAKFGFFCSNVLRGVHFDSA